MFAVGFFSRRPAAFFLFFSPGFPLVSPEGATLATNKKNIDMATTIKNIKNGDARFAWHGSTYTITADLEIEGNLVENVKITWKDAGIDIDAECEEQLRCLKDEDPEYFEKLTEGWPKDEYGEIDAWECRDTKGYLEYKAKEEETYKAYLLWEQEFDWLEKEIDECAKSCRNQKINETMFDVEYMFGWADLDRMHEAYWGEEEAA